MRTLRLSLAGTLILVLLGGLSGAVVAQEEEAADGEGVTEEPLFEVTISPELMPTELGKINLERHELSPGSEVSVGVENEAIRGKSLHVAEGGLLVTPMVDAQAWRGGEANGGTAEVAVAGRPMSLSTGDVIYLPAVAEDRLQPDATVVLANPGETPPCSSGSTPPRSVAASRAGRAACPAPPSRSVLTAMPWRG